MQILENQTWRETRDHIQWGCCLDLASLEQAGWQVRTLNQVHGARIWTDGDYEVGCQGDGLVSDLPGVVLVVRTADCVPVHITDGSRIAMVHAGWRGTAAGILKKVDHYFDFHQVRVAIGPSIFASRYEVDADLYGDWLARDPRLGEFLTAHKPESSKRLFDLRGFVHRELTDLGVPGDQISMAPVCTYDSNLPSYRRQGQAAARIFNYIVRQKR